MKLIAILASAFALLFVLTNAKSTVWPQPKTVEYTNQESLLTQSSFKFKVTGQSSSILNNAIKRYTNIIFRSLNNPVLSANYFQGVQNLAAPTPTVTTLEINVKSSDIRLRQGIDESYQLDTSTAPITKLTANTVFGALRGMETFSQLIDLNYYLTGAVIDDAPRFKYRGFMIDTARHFYPLNVIYQHIDAMSYNKFNVLHWHIVDDQSFPYQSIKFPQMSEQGAFSQRHIYTHSDIQDVIRYALDRGIIVMPEFDTPGHVTRGYEALTPKILTDCYKEGKFVKTGPLNPTLNETYEFLGDFFSEVRDYFHIQGEGSLLHLGGDEALLWCWDNNPQVQAFMQQQGIKTSKDLQAYYFNKVFAMLKDIVPDSQLLVWEEVYTDKGTSHIDPASVSLHIWKKENYGELLKNATRDGFKVVLSGPYYLNYISYGPDWKQYYIIEPTDFEGGDQYGDAIIGLQVCMWSEYIDATNFIARSWPRASAVGERMWSPKTVNNIETAQYRLHEFRCKLMRRNIDAQPTENGANYTTWELSYCPDEYNTRYVPLF